MQRPFFSIVVPTRDRPDCLSILLQSIIQQGFSDYEVVISDNGITESCKQTVESFSDGRLKYFKPEMPLGLCDNFEFAVSHAQGQWVMMMGDKNILFGDALEKIHKALETCNPDILNFPSDWLTPFDPEKDILKGKLRRYEKSGRLLAVDRYEALINHFSCEDVRGGPRMQWYPGTILSGGIYRDEFLKRFRSCHKSGRVFDGVIPDRYGAVEALCLAEKVYYLDDYTHVYNSCGKHTWISTEKKGYDGIVSFIRTSRSGYDISSSLVIPGVVASSSNIVATDYRDAFNAAFSYGNFKQEEAISLNRGVLAATVETELNQLKNVKQEIVDEEKQFLYKFISELSDKEKRVYEEYRKCEADKFKVGLKSRIHGKLFKLCASENERIAKSAGFVLGRLSKSSAIVNTVKDFL